jgi:septal ring factor EnvC (AmiA/AmiB activator)
MPRDSALDLVDTVRAWIPIAATVATVVLALLVMRMRAEISASLRPVDGDLRQLDRRVALVEQRLESMPTDSELAELRGDLKRLMAEIDHIGAEVARLARQLEATNHILLDARHRPTG